METAKKSTGLHIPTFVWAIIAIIVALVIYHNVIR